MAFVGSNMQKVSEDAGQKRTYLQEFMNGKKNSMRGNAFAKIAEVLQCSEMWLLTGLDEPSNDAASATDWAASVALSANAAVRLSSVGPARTISLVLDSLNLNTGESTARDDSQHVIYCHIVDPALLVPESVYARALSTRGKVKCLTKAATTTDGKPLTFILNSVE